MRRWIENWLFRGATIRCQKVLQDEIGDSHLVNVMAVAFAHACYPAGQYRSNYPNRLLACILSLDIRPIERGEARLIVHDLTFHRASTGTEAFFAIWGISSIEFGQKVLECSGDAEGSR